MKSLIRTFPLASLLGLPLLAGAASAVQCEILKLTEMDPDLGLYHSRLGYSVALDGDRMAIGAPAVVGVIHSGSVEVFEWQLTAGAWEAVATVVASDAQSEDLEEFGYSVAIDGDTLVVGATHNGELFAKGAAYVFERQPDGAWIETAKLLPPDDGWAFGWSVAVDGDRIAVGAKGASSLSGGEGLVSIFERQGSVWVDMAMIKPSISKGGDGFGAALDLEGERLVVGAPYGWTSISPFEGLAFVYERVPPGWIWSEKAVLSPEDLADNDRFGQDVALDGDRILVGAPANDLPSLLVGGAYVFDRLDGTWTQTAKLSPADLPLLAYFGWSVDLDGDRAVVGARSDSDLAPGAGAAYLFQKGSKGWEEVEKLYGSGSSDGDSFGYALDLEATSLLVGAPFTWAKAGHPGHAFLFTLDPEGPSLIADAGALSLSQGGTQDLQLGACLEHAGDVYVLGGSATGTRPGFGLGSVHVPLNLDAYFLFTLLHPGVPPLLGSVGVLDAWGRGEASFALPPATAPTLAGLTLHHAYAVLDASSLALEAASNPTAVTLEP